MRKIRELRQAEINGGCGYAAGFVTGVMCLSTVYLAFSPFAPIAAATGIGCALGWGMDCIYR